MISPDGISWLEALATSISFAFLGLLVPNLYKQLESPRRHNEAKVVNEFLAVHEVTYTTFVAAIALAGDFKVGFDWIRKLFALGIALTFGFYLAAVFLTISQDAFFTPHGCKEGGTCGIKVKGTDVLRLTWPSLLMSLILLIVCVLITFAIK